MLVRGSALVSIPLKSGRFVIVFEAITACNDIGFNPLKIGSVCNTKNGKTLRPMLGSFNPLKIGSVCNVKK